MPKAHIVCSMVKLKCQSNETLKFTTVISKKTNQIPLVNKNLDNIFFPFLTPVNHADVPAKKTKIGAQK